MAKNNPFKVATPGAEAGAMPMPMPSKGRKAAGPPQKPMGRQMGPMMKVDDSIKKTK